MMLEGQGLLESSNLTIEMLMVRLFMKDASGQWEWSKVKNMVNDEMKFRARTKSLESGVSNMTVG